MSLLPGFLGGLQRMGEDVIGGGVSAVHHGVVAPTQQTLGGLLKGTTGIDISPEGVKQKPLSKQVQEAQSEHVAGMLGGTFSGVAKTMGMDPKTLLIIGVGGAIAIVVLLVVLKT